MVEKVKRGARFALDVLVSAVRSYAAVRATRMAAAIAYRTFFALAPLLLIAVGVFGAIVGDNAEAQAEILDSVVQVAGTQVGDAVEIFLGSTIEMTGIAAIVGLILVLWTSSSLFHEMQHDLDDIFGVPYEHTANVVGFVRKRGIGFLWSLGLGLVLITVWVVNFAWRFFGGLFPAGLEGLHRVIAVLAPLGSLLLLPVLFGLVIQTMTSVRVHWRAVWYGGAFTAIGFLVTAYLMGVYFSWDVGSSAFTVAGSVFVILLMAFVLSNVFLFGAQVTRVYEDFLRSGTVEAENAAEAPAAVVGQPAEPAPMAAVLGFLGGLFVGWRRSRS